MRIHELLPPDGQIVYIHNEEHGHTLVLTSQGAVYNNADTGDLRNMAVAFGLLTTSDSWRHATSEEVELHLARPPTLMLELQWALPQPRPRPTFRVVK